MFSVLIGLGPIALDGPVASGKSAVGRRLADALGYAFLDTGLMYRAVTLRALELGIDLDNEQALTPLAGELDIEIKGDSRIWVNGSDVSDDLRAPAVDAAVSFVSKVVGVREQLVRIQRSIAEDQNIIMAGRDIGTVVLPGARLKLYLDATIDERARRRHEEYRAAGDHRSLDLIAEALRQRDEIDSKRAASPLRPAEDAHIIKTDGLPVEAVVAEALSLVEKC